MTRGRVLLVSSEMPQLEALRALLDGEFDVVAVGGVAAAFAALDRGAFHAVVSEVALPGGSGVDVLRYACELDVIVAGFLLSNGISDAGLTGFRVLAKTTAPATLFDTLRVAVADVVAVRA